FTDLSSWAASLFLFLLPRCHFIILYLLGWTFSAASEDATSELHTF
ncbi:mCG1034343, partial [Mus musculus]